MQLGENASGQRKLFVATGQAHDAEMKARIARHQKERGDRWQTVEAPVEIVDAIEQQGRGADIMLIDCLTLWTSNLMMTNKDDEAIVKEMELLAKVILAPPCPIILVTNEVGTGIVPENPMARRYRDLTGWCNQKIAQACDRVIWMVAGIPVTIKPVEGAPC